MNISIRCIEANIVCKFNKENAFHGLPSSLRRDKKSARYALKFLENIRNQHIVLATIAKAAAKYNKVIELLDPVLSMTPNDPSVFAKWFECMQHISRWENYDNNIRKLNRSVKKNQLLVSPWAAVAYFSCSGTISKSVAMKHVPRMKKSVAHSPPTRPVHVLRIGYISGEMREHPNMHLIRRIFRHHDRDRFRVYCFACNCDDGSESYAIAKTDCDVFVDVFGKEPKATADQIRRQNIHILVNIDGHTSGADMAIFSYKPAPIQVSYLGSPFTSGAKYFDYYIGDHVATPLSLAHHFTEKLALMPHCYATGDHQEMFKIEDDDKWELNREQYGLPDDAVVYCNFTQLFKINPHTITLWISILEQVEKSVLWLISYSGQENGPENIRAFATSLGFAANRIIFSPECGKHEHVRRSSLADICLDSLQYNGHTTTFDILWGCTPVVTILGDKMWTRVAASILKSLGVYENTVADSIERYREIAINLGRNKEARMRLRDTIRKNRLDKPTYNTQQYTFDLCTLYTKMWTKFINHEEPQHIT